MATYQQHARSVRTRSGADAWTGFALGSALLMMTLVAGLSFTFAAAVMPNLGGVDDHTFVLINQRFNENPVFPITFTLALPLLILATVLQIRVDGSRAAAWVIAALALYVAALLITGAIHIPLNDEIDRAGDPDQINNLAHVRERFEQTWVVWNVVRTLLCIAAVAALGRALLVRGRYEQRLPRS